MCNWKWKKAPHESEKSISRFLKFQAITGDCEQASNRPQQYYSYQVRESPPGFNLTHVIGFAYIRLRHFIGNTKSSSARSECAINSVRFSIWGPSRRLKNRSKTVNFLSIQLTEDNREKRLIHSVLSLLLHLHHIESSIIDRTKMLCCTFIHTQKSSLKEWKRYEKTV